MILSGTIPTKMTEQSLLAETDTTCLVNVHCSEPCKNVLAPAVYHPEGALEFSDPGRTILKKKKKALAKLFSSGRQERQTWRT